jgi:16S rRNA (guanine966-N2)-methyltransferase
VRESIFDILFSLGGVADLEVLDLFCGSGAMGLEALSRGAAGCTFVDRDPAALDAVRQNLAATGLEGPDRPRPRLVQAGLPGWLAGAAPADLALCDPPYDFADWVGLLGVLRTPLAVLESRAEPEIPAPWDVVRARRYGGTLVTVTRRDPLS